MTISQFAGVVVAYLVLTLALPLLACVVAENVRWLRLGRDGRRRALHDDGVCDPDRCWYCQVEMTEDD